MREENLKSQKINEIMNKNLETISYSIVFVSDIVPQEGLKGGDIIEFKPQHDIFKGIDDSWLGLLFRTCGENSVEIFDETKDQTIGIREFRASNGFKFVYEMPYKLTIQYTKSKGDIDDPENYIKNLASELILALKKKTKIHKVGINYEIFFPLNSPQEKIKNEVINQYIKDSDLESGFLKLNYKANPYTKLYLSLTTAKHDNKEGLYFQANFDCTKKGDNQVSDILSKDNKWLKLAAEKIEKLLNLSDDKK
jgi:hypothetical protein